MCHVYKEQVCKIKPNKVKDKISVSFFMGFKLTLPAFLVRISVRILGIGVSEMGMNNKSCHVSACYMTVR